MGAVENNAVIFLRTFLFGEQRINVHSEIKETCFLFL